ncbi:SRPBCC domain-containing protein [Nocardioides sp.]|uniref:SRPBCC domain-containing protein n=1 Tax=Nocardioides sp. TaxID=35761 RepID=UPI00378324CA
MSHTSIERRLHIDASPAVVFDVVSDPAHVRRWWPDEADYPMEPGGAGRIGFRQGEETIWERFQVVDAQPGRLFSFRWTQPEGSAAGPGNSFLVVFEIEPDGDGSLLRMTETGFDERGWDDATAAAHHADHVAGWDHFLARLPAYAASVEVRR